MNKGKKLLTQLRRAYRKVGDPHKSIEMKAYMKSSMPYHGVASPVSKMICKELFKTLQIDSLSEWKRIILFLWKNSKFREERYACLQLCNHRVSRPFQTLKALSVYEYLITDGAWWDFVDDIASHRLGTILKIEPEKMKQKMLQWSRSPNLWKRRSAILCQLGMGKETDLEFLYQCIEPSLGSSEFFLQKAIGWSLRQYAWQNPSAIKKYVKLNSHRLSKLSRREALKNL